MTLQLAVQHIEIKWGKDARGTADGHTAALRNAIPREFQFAPPGDSVEGWFQHIRRVSWEDSFAPRERWQRIEDMDHRYSPIRWRRDGDYMWIGLRNILLQKPSRPHLKEWFARLPIGQRLILRVNTAYDWSGYLRDYYDHVLSIGVSPVATLDLPLFREIDERALLY